jgi:DNA polymerase III alpha subunit
MATSSERSISISPRRKAGVKPILGCELYVAPGSRKDRGSQDGG